VGKLKSRPGCYRAAHRSGGGERSRHGQVEGGWVTLDQFADLTGFETAGTLLYGQTEEDRERVYNQLKKASSLFIVFRRKDVPAGLNYDGNPREGDPVVVATGPTPYAPTRPQAGSPIRRPSPACTATILVSWRR